MANPTYAGRIRLIWQIAGGALLLAVIVLSLIPPPPLATEDGRDKSYHAFAYGVLMYWHAQLYATTRGRRILAVALVALGIGIEFLQALTPARHADPFDALANAAGVALGWLLAAPRTPNWLERMAAGR